MTVDLVRKKNHKWLSFASFWEFMLLLLMLSLNVVQMNYLEIFYFQPIFLQRTLYYMRGRMSRSHKNRMSFKLDLLLDKVRADLYCICFVSKWFPQTLLNAFSIKMIYQKNSIGGLLNVHVTLGSRLLYTATIAPRSYCQGNHSKFFWKECSFPNSFPSIVTFMEI